MTKRVLLVGMNSFDSGKTELAKSLVSSFHRSGRTVEYFKPLSGHNWWYHYEHSKTCLDWGMLVSKDAWDVMTCYPPKVRIEIANPIHSLFVPLRLEKPLQNLTNTLGLSGASSVLTMERFSRPTSSGIDTTVLVAQNLVEEERLLIGLKEVGMLTKGASVLPVNSLEEVQDFESQNFESHINDSFAEVEKSADVVVIEGFNDAAWPWEGLEMVDSVLLVSPGHVFTYDPERFRKAAYLMNRGNLPIREVTFGRISDLLKPLNRLEIRPDTELTPDELEHLGI